MSDVVSISRDGGESARGALERCIGSGGTALFPADTVYGLACDPLDSEAVRTINALKQRPAGKPSAVMFFAPLAMRDLIATLGPRTREALAALLPGPVTVVVANPQRRYPLACGDDPDHLGLRLIAGPLEGTHCGVLQTSANSSGAPAPRAVDAVEPQLRSAVDLIIDGGALPGTASTVIDLSGLDTAGEWRLLREGAMAAAELEPRLGPRR
jgi:L-threonylcarbamoyladenylate synthase